MLKDLIICSLIHFTFVILLLGMTVIIHAFSFSGKHIFMCGFFAGRLLGVCVSIHSLHFGPFLEVSEHEASDAL